MKTSRSSGDLGFRLFTGAFAVLLLAIVAGIGVVLYRESVISVHQFGFRFWITDTWDPVSGEFGARPFIWGTLYSSLLALLIAAPVSLGIATYLSELCPAFLRQLLAAIPSIVYGVWGMFALVPLVRRLELAVPQSWRGFPLFTGPPIGLRMLSAALILSGMRRRVIY